MLPPGEVATRDAITSTSTRVLVTSSGSEFELNLLLVQAEALAYAWHLGKVAASHDAKQTRANELMAMSEGMQQLHDEVVTLLRSRLTPATQ